MRSPISRPSSVNWDDPQLAALLSKSASWSLDNRSNTPEQTVELHLGWSAAVGQPALLLFEKDQYLVVATEDAIPMATPVRVDKFMKDRTRSVWTDVAESRRGQRETDSGLFIHWLHIRR